MSIPPGILMEASSGWVWGLNDRSAHSPRNTSVPMIVKAKSLIVTSFLLEMKSRLLCRKSALVVLEKQPLVATSPAMYYTTKTKETSVCRP